jgi:hypothetical protein
VALYTQTATTDLTAKGKRLTAVHIATTGTASVVNLNNGVGGTTVFQFNGAINTDKTITFAVPVVFTSGVQVQLSSGTVAAITADIL